MQTPSGLLAAGSADSAGSGLRSGFDSGDDSGEVLSLSVVSVFTCKTCGLFNQTLMLTKSTVQFTPYRTPGCFRASLSPR